MNFTYTIAGRIADWLVQGGAVESADRELYAYGADKLLSLLICLVLALALGAIFRILAGSLLFFLLYYLLRVYVGGYHADNPLRCFFISVLVLAVPIVLIWCSAYWYSATALLVCLFTAGAIILIIAPVDNPKKRIDTLERRVYRKRMVLLLVGTCALAVVLFAAGAKTLSAAATCSVLVSAGMAVCGSVKNKILQVRR